MSRFTILLVCLFFASPIARSETSAPFATLPEPLHVYLLIGQSNMAGRASVEQDQSGVIDGCYLFNGEGEWEAAANPLNRYSTIRKRLDMQRLSPGYGFAKAMREREPGISIGLVVNAKGGTKIEEWEKGTDFYADAVQRALDAKRSGKLKGILWHQGEGNSRTSDTYLEKLKGLIADLREDLEEPHLPFVAGQVFHHPETKPHTRSINEVIAQLPDAVPFAGYVESDGLTTFDNTHFDAASTVELGRLYAKVMRLVERNRELTASGNWKLETLAYDMETPEGPVWGSDGNLRFTEIFAHLAHRYDVVSGEFEVIRRESGGSNGMAFDSKNRLLMCEMIGRRVSRMRQDGMIETLWRGEEGGKGGPNDIVVSSRGNAYFTMPRHKRVYRINPDDSVDAFIDELPGINGVTLSKDEQTLYVTEYRNRRVLAFSIDEERGTVGQGRLFASIETEGTEHGADGMAVDDRDRLYVTCLDGIWVFDADGNEVERIEMPGEKVTNCAFAGEDYNTLYVTTQKGLFRATRR